MTESAKKLKELVDSSDNIVFFGGDRAFTRQPSFPGSI